MFSGGLGRRRLHRTGGGWLANHRPGRSWNLRPLRLGLDCRGLDCRGLDCRSLNCRSRPELCGPELRSRLFRGQRHHFQRGTVDLSGRLGGLRLDG